MKNTNMDFEEVSAEEFILFLTRNHYVCQVITWSTPFRYNYHSVDDDHKLIAYWYEAYMDEPAAFYIKKQD